MRLQVPVGTKCAWCEKELIEGSNIVLVKTIYAPQGIAFDAKCWILLEPFWGKVIPYTRRKM